ncbi:hypothetical protein [Vannielia litorea]|uniref:Lipoprotein SmpA/OmlA domain-containing protein n=1 Tax=Vannielia litorea TaxID=1217970 RepID=A0A1N6GKX0_9RHOB|nr:hypothetical protein [Vannielia litorea]SIO08173.1 hypothetical protein SAMN05444002_2583 [Vannielia litorea]
MTPRRLTPCLAAALAALLALAGCDSTGNQGISQETEESVQTKLTEGVTTQAEVRQMFGAPGNVSFSSGGHDIWSYDYSEMKQSALNYIPYVNQLGSSAKGTRKQLVILFNARKVVRRYTLMESEVVERSGLFP